MKKRSKNRLYFKSTIAFFIITIVSLNLLISCKKDTEPEIEIVKENEDLPELVFNGIESRIVKSIDYNEDSLYPQYFTPHIIFKFPIEKEFQIEKYGQVQDVKIVIDKMDLIGFDEYNLYGDSDSMSFINTSITEFSENINDTMRYSINYSLRWQLLDNEEWVNVYNYYDSVMIEEGYVSFKVDKSILGNDIECTFVNEVENFDPTLINTKVYTSCDLLSEIAIDKYIVKPKVTQAKMTTSEGEEVPCSIEINKEYILFLPDNPLTTGSRYSVSGIINWEFYTGETWIGNGNEYPFDYSFETEIIIDQFNSNYEYAYPCINQYHFLKDEYSNGYLKLSKDNDLLNDGSVAIRYSNVESEEFIDIVGSYNIEDKFLNYAIPVDFVENENVYKIDVLKNKGEGFEIVSGLSYFFRTSKFDSFIEKYNTYEHLFSSTYQITTGVQNWTVHFEMEEYFDSYEIGLDTVNGLRTSNGLIQIYHDFNSGNYYNQYLDSLYNIIEQFPEQLTWRTINSHGIPPEYNTTWIFVDNDKYLSATDIENGAESIYKPEACLFWCSVETVISRDAYEFRNHINIPLSAQQLLNEDSGFKIRYVLPGINVITSEVENSFYGQ